MPTRTIRNGRSTMATSARAGKEYGRTQTLILDSGASEGFYAIPLGTALRKGATVTSASVSIPDVGTAPSSLTLRRTVAWTYAKLNWGKRPALASGSANRSGSLSGNTWTFDVQADVQAVLDANGSTLYLKLTTGSTAARKVKGFPGLVLSVEYNYDPDPPTGLKPDGTISGTHPVLSASAPDVSAVQVQVAPIGTAFNVTTGFTSPTHDSGTYVTEVASYPLEDSGYGGLMSGSTSWTMRVRNKGNRWSKYATPAEFTRLGKASDGTITQPGPVAWESSPPFEATMTGLTEHQWFVAKEDTPLEPFYTSKRLTVATTGTAEHTPPAVITEEGVNYVVTAWLWDDQDREDTPGDPAHVVVSSVVTLEPDEGVTGVSSTTAVQVGLTPAVDVTVARAVMPDSFVYLRDGVLVESGLDPTDLEVSSGVYTYRSHDTPPNGEHTHRLVPVVNNKRAAGGTGQSATLTTRTGIRWLGDPSSGAWVPVTGQEQTWARPEDSTAHTVRVPDKDAPSGYRLVTIHRVRGRQAPAGEVSNATVGGTIYGDGVAEIATLKAWQDEPDAGHVYRFVVGAENIAVTVRNLEVWPLPVANDDGSMVGVSFSYWSI